MHPLRDLWPLELTVFHVTNNGCSSLCVADRRINEKGEDLEDDFEFSLNPVRLELAEDVEGEDEEEALAGDGACSLDISRGRSVLPIGSSSSSPTSSPASSSPSPPTSSSSVISTSFSSSTIPVPSGESLYCSQSSSTCFRSKGCRFSKLAASTSKQYRQ